MNQNHYRHLLIMSVLAFASMYVLMYAMVDTFENVYSNLNEVYMAGLMTAPMVVIELVVWGSYARSHMTLRHPFDRLGRQAAA